MIVTRELREASLRNLVDTYLALGRSAGNGEQVIGKGISGYASAFPHPISNFVIVDSLSADQATELKVLATDRPGFYVYLYDHCITRQSNMLMRRAGFRKTHRLIVMAALPTVPPAGIPIHKASTEEKRYEIAHFMLEQFRSSYPTWIRDQVIRATSASEGLELYCLEEDKQIIAAMMLRNNDRSIGLYNLCVKMDERGQGYGQMLVLMVRKQASLFQKPVVLQCDSHLVPWYRKAGFVQTGKLDIYTLSARR